MRLRDSKPGSGLRRSGRSGRGSRGSRGSLGRNALGDHALAAASATSTAAADGLAAAAAFAAAADDLAATAATLTAAGGLSATAAALAGSRGSLAVAAIPTVVAQQAAVATGTMVATVATSTAVAAVSGHGARVTAHEGDRDQREEHSDSKSEKTLHYFSPVRGSKRSVRS